MIYEATELIFWHLKTKISYIVYTNYEDFGTMQSCLEQLNIEVSEASLQRFPNATKELINEQQEDIDNLIERFEDDDDVMKVFHGMA